MIIMFRFSSILVLLLLVFSNYDIVTSKRYSSSHSYPKSGGLSGGGGHSYPSSGGLSGGGSHSYPSSGGLSGGGHKYPSSGGGSHGYPSSGGGGSHSYPSNGGLSGGGSHGYPSSGGGHSYPSSNSQSGSHGYPAGKGLSGNTNTGGGHTTNVHYHYNYNPPQQIRYTPTYGGPARTYPVYHQPPPTYVYQYKDSGSKYGTLLAGLALLNLGTLGVSAYALSKSHSNYQPKPGEVCKFAIKKDNGDYEETRIDCNLISSFIYEEEAKTKTGGTNTTVVTTVTNVTTINMTNGNEAAPYSPPLSNPLYQMLPNGTLVPINVTNVNTTANMNNNTNGTVTSSVIVTTTNTTTLTNALDVKGKPVDVTPGMHCYVISHSPMRNMKRSIPCGLLQTYAEQSLKKNSATRNLPIISIFGVIVAMLVN
ncbi:dermokine-like [Melitaea cinxia]|uniref:dermokine-like n=1 Tax=Melitaea cinxia TaxID=113334 RepID=UPI001E26FCD7|nr:dermokine-like [Melitaea cinxia]